MPDDELLRLGESEPAASARVLDAQVKRMLADPKAGALADNFAGQWLETRSLDAVTPDRTKFPTWNPELRDAMRTETRLFFDAVLRENRPISDFIDGKYTFLNERLARHYGIDGVDGPGLPPRRAHDRSAQRRVHAGQRADRVELSDAHVGRAARQVPARERPQLAAASAAGRRAGARRGQGRRRGVAPRADSSSTAPMPLCASCHTKMDPLGFALENYDAIGRWRTEDGKFPLDVERDASRTARRFPARPS